MQLWHRVNDPTVPDEITKIPEGATRNTRATQKISLSLGVCDPKDEDVVCL